MLYFRCNKAFLHKKAPTEKKPREILVGSLMTGKMVVRLGNSNLDRREALSSFSNQERIDALFFQFGQDDGH